VYGWGTFRDNNGIFGFTKKGDTITRPVQIEKLSNVTSVSCSANTAYALTKTGQVLSWGAGESDQLGRR
jgi:regulator of chromosome condensation